ncbi:hypothetical protein DBIPINDM_001310 [Mesorhizobium sp. AR02]|uniref:hypothetical protein n=1 Tax=Mesorhizobium sp. AR02 TaxID=2865837 RepID=UPI002160270A|nr:hypothetical protein [Mesorhizobium sp. AR02]UVK54844.1 hypothetical protein DBIPINDM_001310 [Mesorhizobium sp. AR02]
MQSRIHSIDKVHVEGLLVIPENPPAIAVSASGWVPTSGWSLPDLTPWIYIVPPKDGILDLDFVATQPTGLVLQVFTKIGVTKAFSVPAWVIGVRVHSSTNSVEARIDGAKAPTEKSMKYDNLPAPWPFPWWAPWGKQDR